MEEHRRALDTTTINLTEGKLRDELITTIGQEYKSIYNMLIQEPLSRKTFILSWDNFSPKIRRRIITNYDDYETMDSFYFQMAKRNLDLTHSNLSDNQLKDINNKCVTLLSRIRDIIP